MVPFLAVALNSDGSVNFDTGSPASNYYWIGPQRYGAGSVFGTTDAVESSDTRAGGFRYTTQGVIRLYDATGGLPAGTVRINGFSVTSDGQLCVTTAAVSNAVFIGGVAVASNGAAFSGTSFSVGALFLPGFGVAEAGFLPGFGAVGG